MMISLFTTLQGKQISLVDVYDRAKCISGSLFIPRSSG